MQGLASGGKPNAVRPLVILLLNFRSRGESGGVCAKA